MDVFAAAPKQLDTVPITFAISAALRQLLIGRIS